MADWDKPVIIFILNITFLAIKSEVQWSGKMKTDIQEHKQQLDAIDSKMKSMSSQLDSLMETYARQRCTNNGYLDYDTGNCKCDRGMFGATCSIGCEEGGNGYTLERTHGLCYKNVSGFMTWTEAKTHCHRNGGRLFVVKDEGSLQALSAVLEMGGYWIGGSIVNGRWRWLDGTIVYPEPSAEDKSCCLFVAVLVENEQKLSAQAVSSCDISKKVFCERV